MSRKKTKILIIGGGQGGASLIEILSRNPSVEITGVADLNSKAPGFKLARKLNIPTSKDFDTFLDKTPSLIINTTGFPSINKKINTVFPNTEIMSGHTAKIVWGILTEQQNIEKELVKAKEHAELLYIVVPSAIFTVDNRKRITTWNKRAEEITGFSAKDVIGKPCTHFAHHPCKTSCGLFEETVTKPIKAKECTIKTKNGKMLFIRKNLDLLHDDTGNITGGIESFEDITSEKEAEQKIIDSEHRFRALFEQSNDAIFIHNLQGQILSVNDKASSLLGMTKKELTSMNLKDIHPESELTRAHQTLKNISEKGAIRLETKFVKSNGIPIDVDISASLIDSEEGIVQGVVRDISERVKMEGIFKELFNRFQSAFDNASIGMALISTEGRWLKVNNALRKIVGRTQDEMISHSFQEMTHPDDLKIELEKIVEILAEKTTSYHLEKRLINKKGKEIWVLSSVSLVKDQQNNPLYFVAQIQDISRRKKSESSLKKAKVDLEERAVSLMKANENIHQLVKELEEKNKRLVKLDQVKSEFVSMVSHELRTPLAIAKGGTGLLLDGISGKINERQHEILSMIEGSIERLLRIINNLLDISKIEAGKTELIIEKTLINTIIDKIVSEFSLKAREKGILLKTKLPDNNIVIDADKDKLIQIMTNLLSNALKFTDDGSITIGVTEHEESIECYVRDNGIGIPKQALDKIFEKFQQVGRESSPNEKGTGLGLSITKALVKLHNGSITVSSTRGKGTTFTFILPKHYKKKP